MIVDMHPVADVGPLSVDGDRLLLEGSDDHRGDEFFGELEGTVVVRSVDDKRGEAVGCVPSADEVIGCGFAGGVGGVGVVA